jgi:hypothetical protein
MKAASALFTVLAMAVVAASAQQPRPDPLETAKANQRIADQKAESEVRKAIDDADKLARAFPDKAVQYLKAAQSNLDLSLGISTDVRKNLTASLQAKLAAVTGKPIPNTGVKIDPMLPIVKAKQDANREKYEAEVKAVREGLSQIKQYTEANQITAANRVVAQLQAKYPDNPAVLSLTQKDNFKNAVAMANDYSELMQKRVNSANFSVDKSAVPIGGNGDVEFPKDWKEKTKNRTNEIKLTEKEQKLIEALDKRVDISIKEKPMEYLLQELSTAMDTPLLIDKESLRALDIDLTRAASLDARGISARNALRQCLAAQGLTYVIRSETIQVMTVEKARETLATRVYYLGDVVQGVGPFGGGATWGPFLDFQQTQANANMIIDAIQDSVDPMSWKKRGGPGTVTFHFPSMSIIVRASSEVHAALGSKLGGK